MIKCKVCGRPLKNPKWVALEMGPVCIKKGGMALAKWTGEDPDSVFETYFAGDGLWVRRVEGKKIFNIPWQIVKHSPTGMEWGYGGSGPADLALNTLAFFAKDLNLAQRFYQDFKWKHIATIHPNGGHVPLKTIMNYIAGAMVGFQKSLDHEIADRNLERLTPVVNRDKA